MRKRYAVLGLLTCSLFALAGWFYSSQPLSNQVQRSIDQEETSPDGRWDYMLDRLVDPQTGELPEAIHVRELAYASTLPKAFPSRDTIQMSFSSVGPYNCGGRTRAFAMDVTNPDIMLAGAVSGGMWRSTNAGASWVKVTKALDHHAVSCLAQDTRVGETSTWYYGAGESVGNSASKSFSAFYRGSGVYKSTDNGLSWNLLPATAALPHKDSPWDMVFELATDPSRSDSAIVYAALQGGIHRSTDGGETWTKVLASIFDSEWTDVHVTSSGIAYAAISSDGGNNRGFWRSTDGRNWVNITPSTLPQNHERTVIQAAPSNEDIVYFFSRTPNAGENESKLHKYQYLSSDGAGSGGSWTDLTSGLENANYNLFSGYCQVLNVKPDDENVVFLGGTNLYRSTNGFVDTLQVMRVGGYSIDGDEDYNYFNGGGKHYPDQQNLFFHPDDPDIMISTTDGGIHRTMNCTETVMRWESLNNGYLSSQFYAIGIDQTTAGSRVVVGGLQDRGTWWTNEADPVELWTHVRGADGAYSEVSDGGDYYYISTQYANIQRLKISENGERSEQENIMPKQLGGGASGGWLFVHPFTLDRVNDNIMYLPNQGRIWRNDNITATDSVELFSSWSPIANVTADITAISSSESEEGVIYFGTRNGRVFRADNAHTAFTVQPRNLNDSISNTGYVSNIAIDPNDADKAIVVFSNYNTISIWYTEDGGLDWEPIEGNLRGTKDEGLPDFLYYIGDGPSIRWAEFAPTAGGNVYFVGTSVGLFATDELKGDSTVWVQQGVESIGNVVVDMMHYRDTDGWMAIGTHGNGIYAGHVEFIATPAGVAAQKQPEALKVYPNPTSDFIRLAIDDLAGEGDLRLTLYDIYGRPVLDQRISEVDQHSSEITLDLSALPAGSYYLSAEQGMHHFMQKIIKQ